MTKVAVIFAEGFEEIEALSPVDVFRRAGFDCSMIGLESTSWLAHMEFKSLWMVYLMVILRIMTWWSLPGGMPGSTNLRDNQALIASLQEASKLENTLLPFLQHQLFSNVLVFLKVANSHVSQVLKNNCIWRASNWLGGCWWQYCH